MNKDEILSMDIIKRVDLYQSLPAEERLRWHHIFDCNCGVPAIYYDMPVEHSNNCPMYNSNNPNYDYL